VIVEARAAAVEALMLSASSAAAKRASRL